MLTCACLKWSADKLLLEALDCTCIPTRSCLAPSSGSLSHVLCAVWSIDFNGFLVLCLLGHLLEMCYV